MPTIAEIKKSLFTPGPDAEAVVRWALEQGYAEVVNHHSVCCDELTWLGPEESSWLGDEHTGCWGCDTGFVNLTPRAQEDERESDWSVD